MTRPVGRPKMKIDVHDWFVHRTSRHRYFVRKVIDHGEEFVIVRHGFADDEGKRVKRATLLKLYKKIDRR